MMNPNDIILKPVISEKTTEMGGMYKYAFRVSMNANKMNVAYAVRELFGVKPEKVNIMRVRGKLRRLRYKHGKKSAWKKAIVTLRPGDKIELFESR